ncbi:MAG TPA: hypothetical protein DIT58_03800, partial [Porticoccaceae bacterium]|nr:hypothetical protein [Porticoccaceae bacterium]
MLLSEYKKTPRHKLLQRVQRGMAVLLLATVSTAWADSDREAVSTDGNIAANAHKEWMCKAGPEGGWQCSAITVPGPTYQRPPR